MLLNAAGNLNRSGDHFLLGHALHNADLAGDRPLLRHADRVLHLARLLFFWYSQTRTFRVRASGLQTVTVYSQGSSTTTGFEQVTSTCSWTMFGTQTFLTHWTVLAPPAPPHESQPLSQAALHAVVQGAAQQALRRAHKRQARRAVQVLAQTLALAGATSTTCSSQWPLSLHTVRVSLTCSILHTLRTPWRFS